jgi:hypothetical protein
MTMQYIFECSDECILITKKSIKMLMMVVSVKSKILRKFLYF